MIGNLKGIKSFFILSVFSFFLSCSLFGEVKIPDESDWTYQGIVLEQSSEGWDRYFGAFAPADVIKKDDTFFLYYIGASGKRSTDGGPANRALGVATSRDGIHFIKYAGNPVLTHQPHNNQEEGIGSAAACLDEDGNIVLYYGAIWAKNNTTESVDVFIMVTKSSDGFNFSDSQMVYNSSENGKENWPFKVIHFQNKNLRANNNRWLVWYGRKYPNSLLIGHQFNKLKKIVKTTPPIESEWFSLEAVPLGNGKIAVFFDNPLQAWSMDLNFLEHYVGPLSTYNLSEKRNLGLGIVLDQETNKWYLYFRTGSGHTANDNRVHLWTAPVK